MYQDETGTIHPTIPASLEAERAVLGSLLLDESAIYKIISRLKPSDFFREAHGWVYEAMLALNLRREPLDYITIVNELENNGRMAQIGGPAFLTDLITNTPTAIYVEHYTSIVLEKATRRKLIASAGAIAKLGFDESNQIDEAVNKAEAEIYGVSAGHIQRELVPVRDSMPGVIDRIDFLGRNGALMGVPTGFTLLDQLLGGLQKSDLMILAGRPGMGKCFGKGTKVLMYDGSIKAVEDVRFGDQLMGPDSKPRNVLSIARGREQMYWVRQNHGIDYRVNASHILSLKRSRNENGWTQGQILNIPLRDYVAKSTKFQSSFKGYKVAVDFPDRALPLDPYFMGLWLGDGRSDDSGICAGDPEVVEYLGGLAQERGAQLKVTLKHNATNLAKDYRITNGWVQPQADRDASIKTTLRHIGVLGDKHIPDAYLLNSKANRLALLAGLIDSDGHYMINQNGPFEITVKNKRLAEQIKFLCDTLGYSTSLIARRATIKDRDFSCEVYRVRFNGNVDEIPTKIARKQAKPWCGFKDWRSTGIVVEPDVVDDYYGFGVDGDHLFLLEDMTVTHNSSFAFSIALNAARRHGARVAIFTLEMSNEQLIQRMLSMVTGIDSHRIRMGDIEEDEWPILLEAANEISNTSIHIDDTPAASVSDVRTKARRLHAEQGLDVLIIDYIQLMTGDSMGKSMENRQQEISYISRSLKGLARELNVPVIALSQLSRAVEARADKRPMLSDLRESGCLTGDTLVYLPDEGRLARMDQLVGRSGFKVASLNLETWKLESSTVSNAFSTGVKEVFAIKTKLGRTIRATANHKFLTIDGWKRLDELVTGEHIALPRMLPGTDNTEMPDSELALLGLLLGDGCMLPSHSMSFVTNTEEVARYATSLVNAVFGEKIDARTSYHDKAKHQVMLYSATRLTHGKRNAAHVWAEKLGVYGKRAHEKFVPAVVFSQSNAKIALFLQHLWSTDGSIRLSDTVYAQPIACYDSNSEQLAKDVQFLLLRLGINARISRSPQPGKGRDMYHVSVDGQKEILAFIDRIGTPMGYRDDAIRRIKEWYHGRPHNTNRDIIPSAVWQKYVKPAMKNGGITHRALHAKMNMAYSGMTVFKQNVSRERAERAAEASGSVELAALAQSDVYWDKVCSVIPDGQEEVYDLTVPGNENFVAGNIIVHNSIEQDADEVIFLYREDYYIEDTDRLNIADVILAKHRHGATGTVPLYFRKELTQFKDLEIHRTELDGSDTYKTKY